MNDLTFPPEVLAESDAAHQVMLTARAYPVPTSHAEYADSGGELKAINARSKRLEKMRVALKAPALETCRGIDEFFRQPLGYLAEAEKAIKRALQTYDDQQEALRLAAERKAADAARREQDRLRAEADRQEAAARVAREKAEEKARAQREVEEVKARALEEAGHAEAAEARRLAAEEAEQRRLEAAQEAEDSRMRWAESTRLAAEAMPTAPVLHIEAPSADGISTRETWSAEIVSYDKLILAIAAGVLARLNVVERVQWCEWVLQLTADTASLDLFNVNIPVANQLARALRGGFN